MFKNDCIEFKSGWFDLDSDPNTLAKGFQYSGMVAKALVGEAVTRGQVLFFNLSTQKWMKANATDATELPALAYVLADAAINTYAQVLIDGYIKNTDLNYGTNAYETLVIGEPPTAADTVTIGDRVYEFVADAADLDAEADVAVVFEDEATAKTAFVAAVNADPYAEATAADFSGDNCVITAKVKGYAGNAIALAETFTHVSNIWNGGADALSNGVEGGLLYVEQTDGTLTLVASTTGTEVNQIVGHALTAERLIFRPSFSLAVVAG
jgi:hypothetical protein